MKTAWSGLIGIDLGTTYSCVAHLSRDGVPATIPNREGDLITPSCILFDESGSLVVGAEAKRMECILPDRTVVCVKRDMGETYYSKLIAGEQYRPEVLSALILKRLRADAETRLGHVDCAVITVPAYFDDTRRKATQDAARLAGLPVLDLLNEPTAAALAYAYEERLRRTGGIAKLAQELDSRPLTALVYDLGGGTFDVSVVRMTGSKFETLATDGDVRLGGRDWDQALVDYASEQFLRQYETDPRLDPESLAALFLAAEQAKHSLSVRATTRLAVTHEGRRLPLEISRELFEQLTLPLLTRTEMTTELVLEAAEIDWSQIDRVLLVGGMTRSPQVRSMIKRISGLEPDASLAADEVVAHGAVIHGALLLARGVTVPPNHPLGPWVKLEVIDVNSHALGIAIRGDDDIYRNSILIPRNTPLPVSVSKTFQTRSYGQKQVRVRVLEGEAYTADACVQIGEFIITDLPPGLPEGSPIEVECRYGRDGRISVAGRDLTSGAEAATQIERSRVIPDEELAREGERLKAVDVN
jgi:molecular chaperone DnaK